jgi:hypothetical protein
MSIKTELATILSGINKTQAEGGWWSTEEGATFGAAKLVEIVSLFTNASKPHKQYFLKFANGAEAQSEMGPYVAKDEDGEYILSNKNYTIDLVGRVSEPTGTTLTDTEGNEYPEMALIPGFFINIVCKKLPSSLNPYVQLVNKSNRVFAGVDNG